jgi:hypothetical protein
MTGGRIVRLLALAALLALTGCRSWCERHYPEPNYAGNCCQPQPQPCCAPATNYPLQPCAPAAPAWNTPSHP